MGPEELAKILIEKLTNKELSALVLSVEDGSFSYFSNGNVYDILAEKDQENYPELYVINNIDKEICRSI